MGCSTDIRRKSDHVYSIVLNLWVEVIGGCCLLAAKGAGSDAAAEGFGACLICCKSCFVFSIIFLPRNLFLGFGFVLFFSFGAGIASKFNDISVDTVKNVPWVGVWLFSVINNLLVD